MKIVQAIVTLAVCWLVVFVAECILNMGEGNQWDGKEK